MQLIAGIIAWHALSENSQETVKKMCAAKPNVQGEVEVRSLPVRNGSGALGMQAETHIGQSAFNLHCDDLDITANVRLDNRAELCAKLGIDLHSSLSDPSLLLHAYRRWGQTMATHLLGDFAFAIWDEGEQRLFCARDIVGARSFYYAHQLGQHFIWASDLQNLMAHPQIPHRLNLAYVKAYFMTVRGLWQHPIHTFYAHVEKLPPAHSLTVDRGRLKIEAYWQPGQEPERRYADEDDYVDELRQLLHEAVACRVQDMTHGVGAHLSGGLDSSSVAVLAHRILQVRGREVAGFSWSPPYEVLSDIADSKEIDERTLIEAVAAQGNQPLRYTEVKPEHRLAMAQRDITVQPTTTLLSELATSQDAAALGIRTMLSGWGGDELLVFNGRGYFADLLRRGRWRLLHREMTLQGQIHGGTVWRRWLNLTLLPLVPESLLRLQWPQDYPPPPALPSVLDPDFAAALANVMPLTRPELGNIIGVRPTQIALLQNGHLAYRMESWASHGATLGITYAYPLLDRRIVEFALSIPDYLYFKDGWKRYLYRTAMAGILPDEVRWHKVKNDPALFQHLRETRQSVGAATHQAVWQEQLRARADNPFLDMTKLLPQEGASVQQAESACSKRKRRLFQLRWRKKRSSIGVGWLAYVNSQATY